MEYHPLNSLVFERSAALQLFKKVPGNGLAFPVRVGRKVERIGALQRCGDLFDPLGSVLVQFPGHGKVFIGAHRTVFGRQIAHMTETGQNAIVLAQVLIDGFRFGRRFDNDNIHDCKPR